MEETISGQNLTKREKRELVKEEKKREAQKEVLVKRLKSLLLGLILVAVSLWGIYKIWQWVTTPEVEIAGPSQEISDKDWVKGNKDAKVTLIEYGDYQCPACAAYAPIVDKLVQDFSSDLRLVYRHFPLVRIHRNAIPSAKAAEAAGLQGKFWEMHTLLYQRQKDWEREANPKEKFVEYAKELGLDVEKFESDFDAKAVEDKVKADLLLSQRLGLNSTPTFFLNAKKLNNIGSYEDFKREIEKEIGK